MTWIEDIGAYLQTHGFSNIYYETFSASSPNSILLIDQPGLPSISTLRKGMTLRKPELGVRVRNSNGDTAHDKADEIYNLLHLKTNTVIGSTRFKKIKGIAEPFYLSKDPNNNYIWSINFSLEIG
jgi:hypothetical protein